MSARAAAPVLFDVKQLAGSGGSSEPEPVPEAAPAASVPPLVEKPAECSEFDWSRDHSDIIFPTTQAVAAYLNESGDLVLRQKAGIYDERDDFVVIPCSFWPDLTLHLKNLGVIE